MSNNQQPLTIQIKYHNEDTPRIKKIAQGDWIDLYASEDVFVEYMKFALIPLGISVKLPRGFEAHIAPRSSTFKNWGVIMANSMGIIDESYCGNGDQWLFPAVSLNQSIWPQYGNKQGSLISKGDKICQFRIVKKMPDVEIVEVNNLQGPDRGGIGSTGTR